MFYWDKALPIHLHVVYMSRGPSKSIPGSTKPKVLSGPSQRMFADHCPPVRMFPDFISSVLMSTSTISSLFQRMSFLHVSPAVCTPIYLQGKCLEVENAGSRSVCKFHGYYSKSLYHFILSQTTQESGVSSRSGQTVLQLWPRRHPDGDKRDSCIFVSPGFNSETHHLSHA